MEQTILMTHVRIHDAIHNPNKADVLIGKKLYPVTVASNGCRSVLFNDILFMEQNKNKNSKYASAARAGKHITWGICSPGPWLYIDDAIADEIKSRTQFLHHA